MEPTSEGRVVPTSMMARLSSRPRRVSVPFAGVDCDAICAINVGVTTVRAHKRGVIGIRPTSMMARLFEICVRSVPFAGVDCDAICAINVGVTTVRATSEGL